MFFSLNSRKMLLKMCQTLFSLSIFFHQNVLYSFYLHLSFLSNFSIHTCFYCSTTSVDACHAQSTCSCMTQLFLRWLELLMSLKNSSLWLFCSIFKQLCLNYLQTWDLSGNLGSFIWIRTSEKFCYHFVQVNLETTLENRM